MQGYKIRFAVPDISCDHCKAAIEAALAPRAGIEEADVDVAGKVVTVSYDRTLISVTDIAGVVEEQGYEVAGSEELDGG